MKARPEICGRASAVNGLDAKTSRSRTSVVHEDDQFASRARYAMQFRDVDCFSALPPVLESSRTCLGISRLEKAAQRTRLHVSTSLKCNRLPAHSRFSSEKEPPHSSRLLHYSVKICDQRITKCPMIMDGKYTYPLADASQPFFN
jgi:hypothetical protein